MAKKKNPHAGNSLKRRARRLARYAVETGVIAPKPCEECGSIDAQKHHDDYDAPSVVRWLCPKHHMVLHLDLIPCCRGEANGQAKLTSGQVLELRAQYAAGRSSTAKYSHGKITQYELASIYGISQPQVFRILNGTRWNHV